MIQNKHGFTIVELLIVVVVIAILAAITIVSYNGITAKANDSAVSSSLETTAKQLMTSGVEDDSNYCHDDLSNGWVGANDCLNSSPILTKTPGAALKKDADAMRYYVEYTLDQPVIAAKSTSGKIFRFSNGSVQEITSSEYENTGPGRCGAGWAIWSSISNEWTTDYYPC